MAIELPLVLVIAPAGDRRSTRTTYQRLVQEQKVPIGPPTFLLGADARPAAQGGRLEDRVREAVASVGAAMTVGFVWIEASSATQMTTLGGLRSALAAMPSGWKRPAVGWVDALHSNTSVRYAVVSRNLQRQVNPVNNDVWSEEDMVEPATDGDAILVLTTDEPKLASPKLLGFASLRTNAGVTTESWHLKVDTLGEAFRLHVYQKGSQIYDLVRVTLGAQAETRTGWRTRFAPHVFEYDWQGFSQPVDLGATSSAEGGAFSNLQQGWYGRTLPVGNTTTLFVQTRQLVPSPDPMAVLGTNPLPTRLHLSPASWYNTSEEDVSFTPNQFLRFKKLVARPQGNFYRGT